MLEVIREEILYSICKKQIGLANIDLFVLHSLSQILQVFTLDTSPKHIQ